MKPRICVCGTQVPFSSGGAEILADSLVDELRRRGFDCEQIRLPFSWTTANHVLRSAMAWRMIDLRTLTGDGVDLVITTRFPSYLIRHPNKVVWLIHQFRQVYDLMGTRYSEYGDRPQDHKMAEMVRAMDGRGLGEARALYTISRNTAERLKRYNQLEGQALYPPPKLGERLRGGEPGDYVFTVGRLDAMKRFDLLIRAMRHAAPGVRCVIAGRGPDEESLRSLIARHGLEGRVELAGFVDDDDLVQLYAGALAVYYAPYDEDYGYVTVEAFKAGKPVVTTSDAGGVLEFVRDGVNGRVCSPDSSRGLGRAISELAADRDLAERMGAAGRERVRDIAWDEVIARLTETLPG